MKNIQIPFDKYGELLSYPSHLCVWKENCEFQAIFRVSGFERGRSAAHFILEAIQIPADLPNGIKSGKSFPIFMTDLLDLIQNKTIINGNIESSLWTFCKRGKNYAVKLADTK